MRVYIEVGYDSYVYLTSIYLNVKEIQMKLHVNEVISTLSKLRILAAIYVLSYFSTSSSNTPPQAGGW